MRSKHIFLLGSIFIVLLSILLTKKILIKPQIETSEYKRLDVWFEPKDVYGVEIRKKDEYVKFSRDEDIWRITSKWNVRAKSQKIEELIKGFSSLEGELRSSSPKLFSDFGISDDTAFKVTLSDKGGKNIYKFYLGTNRPSYDNCFLRVNNSADIYLVNKDLFPLINIYGDPKNEGIAPERWIDLSFIKFDVDKIKSIKVQRFNKKTPLITAEVKKIYDEKKKLNRWVVEGAKPVFDIGAKKIKDYLKNMNGLYVKEVVDPKGKGYGFDDPYIKVSLGTDDEPIEIVIGNIADEKTKARYTRTSEGLTFIIRENVARFFDIDISKFFKSNPLGVDKDKLKLIEIKSDKKFITLDKDLIEKNVDYIDRVKKFWVEKMLFDEKYSSGIRGAIKYSLRIVKDDNSELVLKAKKESDVRFIAQLSGHNDVFMITSAVFEDLFKKLDKLDLKKETSKNKK